MPAAAKSPKVGRTVPSAPGSSAPAPKDFSAWADKKLKTDRPGHTNDRAYRQVLPGAKKLHDAGWPINTIVKALVADKLWPAATSSKLQRWLNRQINGA